MHQIVCVFLSTHILGQDFDPIAELEGSARPSHKELSVNPSYVSTRFYCTCVLVSLRSITSPSEQACVLQPGFFSPLPLLLLPLTRVCYDVS